MSNNIAGDSQMTVASVEMGIYCFDTLVHHLKSRTQPQMVPQFTSEPYPLFVTWMKGNTKKLRGCIGTFKPVNLHTGIREYALESAFGDTRFDKISIHEVPELHVGVSILINFEDAEDYLDWEVGKHGIKIEFTTNTGQRKSATYLPEVASEQRWNKLETIDSLIRKSGFIEPIDDTVRQSIKLTRYQSEKISCSYKDYEAWLHRPA